LKISDNKKIALFFFIFSIGLILTFIVLDILFYSYNIKQKLMNNAVETVKIKESFLINTINKPKNILLSIRKSKNFISYLDNQNSDKKNMNDIFFILTNQDKNIMQLRFLDKNGKERLRVDRDNLNKKPILVLDDKLQDKSSRYYFQDSKDKKAEKVWFSNLDLNIERGKIEIPYKPTIRLMLPIYKNNVFSGVLVINYHMKSILNELVKSSFYDIILLDELGFPLIHYNKEKNWSFYKKKITISNEYKTDFDQILSTDFLIKNDFISNKLSLDLPKKLILILKLKNTYLNEYKNDRLWHYLVVGIIVLILSMIMSIFFTKQLKKFFVILKDARVLNKLLNKKVKNKTQELYEKQKQYQNILQTINDFIWEVDIDGKYIYASPQVEKILGYKPEDVLGKTPFDFMPDDESEKLKLIFDDIMKNRKSILLLKNKNVHKNGEFVYLETSGNPIFDKQNRLIGYRGTDRDITSKIKIQEKLKQNHIKIKELNKDLESKISEEVKKNHEKDAQIFAQSKMAAMGDMIANIAHQWRQPLSTISTTASGLKLNYEYEMLDNKSIPEEMNRIVKQTKYLSNTIDTFMSFLKDNRELKKENLKLIISNTLQILKSSLDNNFIKVNHNLEEIKSFEIETIPSELQEAIINIINNSKDAITENKIKDGLISINIKIQEDKIFIAIEDNGGGIPNKIIRRVFEPYFTTKYKSQGTGLGLHMVYRVITESLNGSISVENSLNGAMFTIILPRKLTT
jgi:PAS domain S-box-containing protein